MFVLSHLFLAFLNNASHGITSILLAFANAYYIIEGMSRFIADHTAHFSGQWSVVSGQRSVITGH